jgi:hypothetical protein
MTLQVHTCVHKHPAMHTCAGKRNAVAADAWVARRELVAGTRGQPLAPICSSRWAPLIAIMSCTGHAVDLPSGRTRTR